MPSDVSCCQQSDACLEQGTSDTPGLKEDASSMDLDLFEGFDDDIDEDYEFEAFRRRLRCIYMENNRTTSNTNDVALREHETCGVSTEMTENVGSTFEKRDPTENTANGSSQVQMDTQPIGFDGKTQTRARDTCTLDEATASVGQGNAMDPRLDKKHTPAFNIARKLRRRQKAQAKKKKERACRAMAKRKV